MTAVEWLAEELTLPEYGNNPQWVLQVIQQAKEMEKQQIKDAYWDGADNFYEGKSAEKYYKKTYITGKK